MEKEPRRTSPLTVWRVRFSSDSDGTERRQPGEKCQTVQKIAKCIRVGGRSGGAVWKVVILSGPASSHSPNTYESELGPVGNSWISGRPGDLLRSNKVATCPGCEPPSQAGRLEWTPVPPLTPLTAGGAVMADGWTDEWMLFVESTLPEGSCIYPITSLEPA